jgi:hypothetical protein
MRQAQKMQEKMARIQEELANERIEHSTGGGMVKCVVNGQGEVLSISIDPEALTEGHEMLEDMILMAVREALAKSSELQQQRMSSITGGINIPGMM